MHHDSRSVLGTLAVGASLLAVCSPLVHGVNDTRLRGHLLNDPINNENWLGQYALDDPSSGGCRLLIQGFGPMPDQDTPEAFGDFQLLQDISTSAIQPPGYTLLIANADGSILPGKNGYLGFEILQEYNTEQCADFCTDNPRCGSFNICECRHWEAQDPR